MAATPMTCHASSSVEVSVCGSSLLTMPSNQAWGASKVSDKSSKNYDRSSEKVVFMNSVVEASRLVRSLAEPFQIGDTIKAQIDRAARKVPFWNYSRIRSAWYADNRMRIDADELAQLRLLVDTSERARQDRDELAELRHRLSRIETALMVSDPQFHRSDIDAYRAALRLARGMGGPLDED
jgi:hypothetical protein